MFFVQRWKNECSCYEEKHNSSYDRLLSTICECEKFLIIGDGNTNLRSVLKTLTTHKEKHVAAPQTFLQRFAKKENELFEYIVTKYETWVSYTNVESKQQ